MNMNKKIPQGYSSALKAILMIFQNKILRKDMSKYPTMCWFSINQESYILNYQNIDSSFGKVLLSEQNIINLKFLYKTSGVPYCLDMGTKKVTVSIKDADLCIQIERM